MRYSVIILGAILALPHAARAQDCDFSGETVTLACLREETTKAYNLGLRKACGDTGGQLVDTGGVVTCLPRFVQGGGGYATIGPMQGMDVPTGPPKFYPGLAMGGQGAAIGDWNFVIDEDTADKLVRSIIEAEEQGQEAASVPGFDPETTE